MSEATTTHTEIKAMKTWCMDNYDNGADTMVECWGDSDYEELFESNTTEEAWDLLKRIVAVYKDRQADAENSAFWTGDLLDFCITMWYNISWLGKTKPSASKPNP